MAVRIQNLPKKNFGQAHLTFTCPSWWNYNEQQNPRSLSKNVCFKLERASQLYSGAKHLGLQLLNQDSSSTQSFGQSQNAMGGTSSQDQCISSESGEFESCEKSAGGRMNPVFSFRTPEIPLSPSQVDNNLPVARGSFPYADHFFNGLLVPNGPQTIMGSQIVGITSARVPLPFDLAEDGLIYVNAKQYHGILRRRQSRAKLEAQNRLVKARKPYLHESRHLHALNRVRGSGGRFLSKKKAQQLDPSIPLQDKGPSQLEGHHISRTLKPSVSNGETNYRQQEQFSGMPVRIGGGIKSGGNLMHA